MFSHPRQTAATNRVRPTGARLTNCLVGTIILAASMHAHAFSTTEVRNQIDASVGQSELSGEWQALGGAPLGCDGDVAAMAANADRSIIYLGGEFTMCGDILATNVVAFYPDTGELKPLGASSAQGVDGAVHALLVHQETLYVTGLFRNAGPMQDVGSIAKWDGKSWSQLGTGLRSGNSTAFGLAMAIHHGDLVIGGHFTHADNQISNNIARWNGQTWLSFGVNGSIGMSGLVNTLVSDQSTLYAGGLFAEAGGQPARSLAAWNGSSWTSLGSGLDWYMLPVVHELEMHRGELYVAGNFTNAGGFSTTGIARWNGLNWSAVGPISDVWGIKAMLSTGDDLIATGNFTMAGGKITNGIARWDGTSWRPMGSGLRQDGRGYGQALLALDGDLYVAGGFEQIDDVAALRVARYRSGQWAPALAESRTSVHSGIRAMASFQQHLYAGGLISLAGDVRAHNIARWAGNQWHALTGSTGTGVNGTVNALQPYEGTLIVAGDFSHAGGIPSAHLARWTGEDWEAFPIELEIDVSSPYISTLASDGTSLFVAGRFHRIGGVDANGVARWDGQTWHAMGEGVGQNGAVNQLLVAEGELYMASFTAHDSSSGQHVVLRWDGLGWETVGAEFGNGYGPRVSALAHLDNELYAAGRFGVFRRHGD
jgi:hypothetical protein